MIEVVHKKNCCGCYACLNICPQKCITMKIDNEGFYYPFIDHNKCTNCGLCNKCCPVINDIHKKEYNHIAYACKAKDSKVRENSSSGGMFYLLCKEVLSCDGVVFGAAYDERLNVNHIMIDNLEDCYKIQGSKYLQSQINQTFTKCREYLNKGKQVLYSGTQCQIKALNLFLGKEYENLITVDVICHGVPSYKVFSRYLEGIEKKHNQKVLKFNFRDKRFGWKNYWISYILGDNSKQEQDARKNIYMKGFLNDIYLRPSCYNCPAKSFKSNSDITLGDFWGIDQIESKFDDDKGISLLIINSDKGNLMFNKISEDINYIESDLDCAIKNNPSLISSCEYTTRRKAFYNNFDKVDLQINIEQCIKDKLINRIFRKIVDIKNKILNRIVK